MRVLLMIVAALGLSIFTGRAAAQPPPAWFFEVSAAGIFGGHGWFENVSHLAEGGAAWNATVGRYARPWLAVTADVGVLRVDEALYGRFIPEDTWTYDPGTHTTFMTSARFESQVASGLASSLEVGAGLGRMHWGDHHVTTSYLPGDRTFAGHQEVAWGWCAGLRLRYVSRARVAIPQAIARVVVLHEDEGAFLVGTLGLGLRY